MSNRREMLLSKSCPSSIALSPLTLLNTVTRCLCHPQGYRTHFETICQNADNFIAMLKPSSHSDDAFVEENIPHCPNEVKSLLSFLILPDDDSAASSNKSSNNNGQLITIILHIIEIVKILLHQSSNRQGMDKLSLELTVKAYTHYMQRKAWKVTTEIANIWINLFYTQANTLIFVKETKGLACIAHSLVSVNHKEVNLFCSLLGALQAICFIPIGRHYLRSEAQIIPIIASCIDAQDERLQERALAIINNMSVDLVSIPLILTTHCLPSIIQKTAQYCQPAACHAALGALTNLLRDEGCCARVDLEAMLPSLLETLARGSQDCQVAALSCLLNLLGVRNTNDDDGAIEGNGDAGLAAEKKRALHSMLAEVLALGSIMQCLA